MTVRDYEAPPPGLLAAISGKLGRGLRAGPYSRRISIGLRRDLKAPFTPPVARVPLVLRDLRCDDMRLLFPPGGEASGERERAAVLWRLERVARGDLVSRCIVAADERSGFPYHVQWLTQPGCSDELRRACALPTLGFGEALLENAFTPVGHRGLGIMSATIALIGQQAAAGETQVLMAFVDVDNHASLAGAKRAGLSAYTVRTWERYGFGIAQRVHFAPGKAEN